MTPARPHSPAAARPRGRRCLPPALALLLALAVPHPGGADPSSLPPAAASALAGLAAGNQRFVEGAVARPGPAAMGIPVSVRPRAAVLACSDARVPTEQVFDQQRGELYVVRVMGCALDAAGVASLEYAVDHLGAPLIVVLGHDDCEVLRAALTVDPAQAGSPDLTRLLLAIHPHVARFGIAGATATSLETPMRAHAVAVASELLGRSRLLRGYADLGRLAVIPGVVSMATGRVTFGNPDEAPSARPASLAADP